MLGHQGLLTLGKNPDESCHHTSIYLGDLYNPIYIVLLHSHVQALCSNAHFTELGAFSPLPLTCQREFGGGLLVHSEFLKYTLIHPHTQQDTFTH